MMQGDSHYEPLTPVEAIESRLDHEARKGLLKLRNLNQPCATLGDVASIDLSEVASLPSVGATYRRSIGALQESVARLMALASTAGSASEAASAQRRHEAPRPGGAARWLNLRHFRAKERDLIWKHQRGGIPPTAHEVANLDLAAYAELRGVGETKLDLFRGVRCKARLMLDSHSPVDGTMMDSGRRMNLADLDRHLALSFAAWLASMEPERATIARGLLAWGQARLSSHELARQLGKSVTWVNLEHDKIRRDLPWSLDIHPEVLRRSLAGVRFGQAADSFPRLAASIQEALFVGTFLEHCCPSALQDAAEQDSFERRIEAAHEAILACEAGPLDPQTVALRLRERGFTVEEAHEARAILSRRGCMRQLAETWDASGLPAQLAVVHVLLGHPEGATAEDVAREIRDRGLVEGSFDVRVFHGMSLQPVHSLSGGLWRHDKFLSVDGDARHAMLAQLAHALRASGLTEMRITELLLRAGLESACCPHETARVVQLEGLPFGLGLHGGGPGKSVQLLGAG
ncbi:MAG: hypothetical protein RL112_788 [Planctomycetota bacterium]